MVAKRTTRKSVGSDTHLCMSQKMLVVAPFILFYFLFGNVRWEQATTSLPVHCLIWSIRGSSTDKFIQYLFRFADKK
jgi:hypothetical protein